MINTGYNRFYCNPIIEPVTELLGSQAHHLSSVMRMAAGEKIELFDGKGALAVARIVNGNNRKVTLQIETLTLVPQPAYPKVVIAVSIAKADRFDWLIGKCTELGVDRICPVLFERTVKQAKNPKIAQRWQNITIAAAKQCRRLFLPQVDMPKSLVEVLQTLKNDYSAAKLLYGSLEEEADFLINRPAGKNDVAAFVGPEGGLTDNELLTLQNNDVSAVRITNNTLRVETAATALATILAARRDAQGV